MGIGRYTYHLIENLTRVDHANQYEILIPERVHDFQPWPNVRYRLIRLPVFNRRVWEHHDKFKRYLKRTRAMAIDMETATLFSAAFKNNFSAGALLLVSDVPMTPDGVKTDASDAIATVNHADMHVDLGIASLKQLINKSLTVKHLQF